MLIRNNFYEYCFDYSRVWSFCTTLRDDGVGYGDYLEQLTYLIFLKMADEYAKPPYNRDVGIPERNNWQALISKKGAELEALYVELLRGLGTQTPMRFEDLADFIECYNSKNPSNRKETWHPELTLRDVGENTAMKN